MNVTIFKELTTTEHLADLQANSDQYIGLYVDMNIAEQRKYVKSKAVEIKDIIKAVNSARIKKTKDYKKLVDVEAADIVAALEKANEPFTLLIDGYDAERKVILDAQKASKLAIENAAQKLIDHEFALLIDKSYLADKLAAEKSQTEHDEAIRIDATNRATQAAKNAQEVTDRAIALDAANRLANKEHIRHINRLILKEMHGHGLPEKESIEFIKTIARKQIALLTINY
tara:strand:+ start:1795 stop:2481 length:687 start_codon:yes stop_codon:yes gene_type:complete